jgi:hypothetical protein
MRGIIALLLVLLFAGCDESMDRQNRFKTYGSAAGMPNWPSVGEALPLVKGTVSQGNLQRAREISEPPPVSPGTRWGSNGKHRHRRLTIISSCRR